MNLENSIKDVITKKLEEGFVEKAIAEQLENGVKNALKDLFGSYGEVTKVIEKQVTSVMVPYLERYDYSKYIVKLDAVLVEILSSTSLEHKNILENFKELIIPEERKTIKTTELFEHWMEHVAKNVETDGLDICYEDEPTYENVEVRFDVEYNNERSWSDIERAVLVFECDHDESLNVEIPISRWKEIDKENQWTINYERTHDLNSLRYLDKFEILMMKLKQNYTKLILDSEGETDEVEPKEKPEPFYE
ncbi:hypothetical protein ABE354_08680 [Brevibacillus laterosporus]|uniref:hypothetical protein n=1 Tax=Brevibacillus laterosporus TaxID=1465 RepID=UPI003D1CB7D3